MSIQSMELQFKYNRYENFKTRLDSMLSSLSNASANLESANTSITNTFTINDIGADDGLIKDLISRTNTIIDSLKKISSEVDKNMESLKNQSTELEQTNDFFRF